MKESIEWAMAEGRCSIHITMENFVWMGDATIDGYTIISVRDAKTIDELRNAMNREISDMFTDLTMMAGNYLPKEG